MTTGMRDRQMEDKLMGELPSNFESGVPRGRNRMKEWC